MKPSAVFAGAVALGLCGVAISTSAAAQTAPTVVITLDENGNGVAVPPTGANIILPSSMQADPGPGGLSSVLTYTAPQGHTWVAGDVFLQDMVGGVLQTLDVIRFNPATGNSPATIVFYSDNVDGFDALGDTSGPPGANYTNTVTLPEVGLEGLLDGAIYTPTANQPGFVPNVDDSQQYVFISDSGAVPEPATWAMMLLGFGAIGAAMRRSRRKVLAV